MILCQHFHAVDKDRLNVNIVPLASPNYAGGPSDTGLKLKVRIRYECEATGKMPNTQIRERDTRS